MAEQLWKRWKAAYDDVNVSEPLLFCCRAALRNGEWEAAQRYLARMGY